MYKHGINSSSRAVKLNSLQHNNDNFTITQKFLLPLMITMEIMHVTMVYNIFIRFIHELTNNGPKRF